MIQPLGHHILVKPEKIEDIDPAFQAAKRAGIIIETDERKREQAAVDKGIVVAIGSTAYKDYDCDPWCQVGDQIGYSRYGGKFLKDPETGEDYIILNDGDIICRYAVKESND
jgi:co-chaperonin GroES (HSP10)